MGFNLLVLGAGFMGKPIAKALSEYGKIDEIGLFSKDESQLREMSNIKKIRPIVGNVNDKNFGKILKEFDLIIGALPSSVGLKVMKKVIENKRDLIDVSAIEGYLRFSNLAKKKGVKVIPECGLSPGLMNFLIGYETTQFDSIENIEVKAGTLAENLFPVTWCIDDLVGEYFCPVRIVREWKVKEVEPLSGLREEVLPKIGRVETFFVDGLGSLLQTIKIRSMDYRNIRSLGFVKMVKGVSSGDLKNIAISAKDKLGKNITTMFIDISGEVAGKRKENHWQIFSEGRKKINSMQRIVSIMVATFTKLLLEDKIVNNRILLMENLGKDPYLFKSALKNLKKRGIEIKNSYS